MVNNFCDAGFGGRGFALAPQGQDAIFSARVPIAEYSRRPSGEHRGYDAVMIWFEKEPKFGFKTGPGVVYYWRLPPQACDVRKAPSFERTGRMPEEGAVRSGVGAIRIGDPAPPPRGRRDRSRGRGDRAREEEEKKLEREHRRRMREREEEELLEKERRRRTRERAERGWEEERLEREYRRQMREREADELLERERRGRMREERHRSRDRRYSRDRDGSRHGHEPLGESSRHHDSERDRDRGSARPRSAEDDNDSSNGGRYSYIPTDEKPSRPHKNRQPDERPSRSSSTRKGRKGETFYGYVPADGEQPRSRHRPSSSSAHKRSRSKHRGGRYGPIDGIGAPDAVPATGHYWLPHQHEEDGGQEPWWEAKSLFTIEEFCALRGLSAEFEKAPHEEEWKIFESAMRERRGVFSQQHFEESLMKSYYRGLKPVLRSDGRWEFVN